MSKLKSSSLAPQPISIDAQDTAVSPSGRVALPTRRSLFLGLWVLAVLAPWLMQLRSFVYLELPHKIPEDLLSLSLERQTANVSSRCGVRVVRIAGIWWKSLPTHYFPTAAGTLCHFVVPQYSIHGNYRVESEPVPSTLLECAGDARHIKYYFYHGSIGYLAFYEQGHGEVCSTSMHAAFKVGTLGTADMNGRALADDAGVRGYRNSYWFLIYGVLWLSFRALVLRRSWVLYLRYIDRRLAGQDRIWPRDAIAYLQEIARLTAHDARGWHRVVIVYMLIEGLMADLYLVVTTEGFRGFVQSVSLVYNLSAVLVVLFEMTESRFRFSWLLRAVKRLLFNHEISILGECACAFAIQSFITLSNRTKMGDSTDVAEAVSYYVWGLVGHLVPVSMIIFLLMAIRAVGSMVPMLWVYRSLAPLTGSCSVESALGVRQRLALTTGYVERPDGLYFTRSTLRAYVLLVCAADCDATVYLVQEKVRWFATPPNGFVAVGVVRGSNVEWCSERSVVGEAALCDCALGGRATKLVGLLPSHDTARTPQ